jgi:hypothetical protein
MTHACQHPFWVQMALKSFVDANEDPGESPNYFSSADDPVDAFLDMLPAAAGDAMFLGMLLKALKVCDEPAQVALRAPGTDSVLAAVTVAR